MSITSVLISRHSHRSHKFELLILCSHFIPMRRRSCFRWKAFSLSVSDPVRPHVPALYRSTGRTNALYKRNRSRSLTCCLRSQRDHMERKAVTASIFRRDKSSTFPSRDPSLFVVLHFSATQSILRLMFVRSVLSTLSYMNHSPSAAGAHLIDFAQVLAHDRLRWNQCRLHIASQCKLMSAGGRRGRHPRKVRRAASIGTLWRVLAIENPLVECSLLC